jgi:hypothetical protein
MLKVMLLNRLGSSLELFDVETWVNSRLTVELGLLLAAGLLPNIINQCLSLF